MLSLSKKNTLLLNLFLVYFIWGSTYLGVKICLETLPPLLLTFIRFLLGGTILFSISILSGHKLPNLEQAKGSIYLGILFSGIGTGTIAYGIKYIPSGIVALLVALLPLWYTIIDFLFFSKKTPNALAILGLLIGIIGIGFLINPFEEMGSSKIPLMPLLLIFVGCISWAIGSIISPNITQATAMQSTSIQMLSGGFFVLIISLISEDKHLEHIKKINLDTIYAMAYLVLIGSLIGYTAFLWLINNAPPILASTYAYVNPVVALVLGAAFGGEKLSSQAIISSGIILIGVILMTISNKR
jgi:drug/metabolite transporter (DMT)-like permease